MICYVDLEHPERGPSILTDAPEATQRKADLVTIAARFERLSGVPCLLQHFSRVDHETLAGLGVHTVILSGHSTVIDDYDPADLAPLLTLIREWSGLYGVQFHPERYTETHPDGRAILGNFFRVAGLTTPTATEAALADPAR